MKNPYRGLLQWYERYRLSLFGPIRKKNPYRGLLRWYEQYLAQFFPIKKPKPKPPKPPKPTVGFVTMYDDINLNLIPVGAEAVAGYVDGKWPTYAQLVKKFPLAKYRLSIAVFASDDAKALDVEPGDATIAQAPGWVRKEQSKGNKKPILYTAASWGQKLVDACTAAGLVYGKDYLWWSAHYNGSKKPHLCSPSCGFGIKVVAHATQWTDVVNGVNLDQSICTKDFFEDI